MYTLAYQLVFPQHFSNVVPNFRSWLWLCTALHCVSDVYGILFMCTVWFVKNPSIIYMYM